MRIAKILPALCVIRLLALDGQPVRATQRFVILGIGHSSGDGRMVEELAEIKNRFDANLERVSRIRGTYEESSSGTPGRQTVDRTDLLRAAVVFLHASLEDFVRSLAEWRWPLAMPNQLATVALATKDPKDYNNNQTTFRLPQLAQFRGSTVDEVIAVSVRLSLARENFNDPGEMKTALVRCGLDSTVLDAQLRFDKVGPMIARRHQIVHRMDANPKEGYGQHMARSLNLKTVKDWEGAVKELAATITRLFTEDPR